MMECPGGPEGSGLELKCDPEHPCPRMRRNRLQECRFLHQKNPGKCVTEGGTGPIVHIYLQYRWIAAMIRRIPVRREPLLIEPAVANTTPLAF